MKKLFRTCIEQTGIAIYKKGNKEIMRPMFSLCPREEAKEVMELTGDELIATFYSNSMMGYKIESLIKEFIAKNKYLPENYVEELVNGFPFIIGRNTNYMYCYS